MKNKIMYLGSVGKPIAKIISITETENCIKTEIEPIFPMTKEKLEQGMKNIMKALS
jgi:hypothetical protein